MDLTDPLVRDMADFNHRPAERWMSNGAGSALVGVHCETCEQAWPCETRRELRRIEAEER